MYQDTGTALLVSCREYRKCSSLVDVTRIIGEVERMFGVADQAKGSAPKRKERLLVSLAPKILLSSTLSLFGVPTVPQHLHRRWGGRYPCHPNHPLYYIYTPFF